MKWQQQTESLTWQAARSNRIKVHSEENYLSLRHWELAWHNQASIAMTPHASRLNIFSSIFLSHQKWVFFLHKNIHLMNQILANEWDNMLCAVIIVNSKFILPRYATFLWFLNSHKINVFIESVTGLAWLWINCK